MAVAFGFVQAGAADGRQGIGVEIVRQPGQRPVGFVHAAVLEEDLVGASGFWPAGEQQQPGGHAVQPVDGHKVGFIQFYAQAGHRGLADKTAVGGRSEEVRFVDHHDVAVFIEHGEVERDGIFVRDRTVEEVEAAGHDGVVRACGAAGFVGQAAAVRVLAEPGAVLGRMVGELLGQPGLDRFWDWKVGFCRGLLPTGSAQAGCADPLTRRKRTSHRNLLGARGGFGSGHLPHSYPYRADMRKGGGAKSAYSR